ncbi:MAG: electron transfer flavoprotein subunit beta/FixA family protein [Solirubrobacterales bacterium]|nr:electron transfer flavoprotein subunit beta/FixA family protein [Solirubrobacterales bacterium]
MFKIVVPIKQVALLDDEFELEPGASEVDPDWIDRELNDWDTFAVEAAVTFKEEKGDCEVVVITVGDEDSEEALVDCLARGADRAIRIPSDDLPPDPLAVAAALAAAIRPEEPSLVLCGVQSSDAASSATGVALSGYLDLPRVAVVRAIELDPAGGKAKVVRELEDGLLEDVSVSLPSLLTVQTGANEPRYATLRAIKQAADKPLATVAAEELGTDTAALAAQAGATVSQLANRPKGEGAEMLSGDSDEVAAALIEILKERAGVANGGGS